MILNNLQGSEIRYTVFGPSGMQLDGTIAATSALIVVPPVQPPYEVDFSNSQGDTVAVVTALDTADVLVSFTGNAARVSSLISG